MAPKPLQYPLIGHLRAFGTPLGAGKGCLRGQVGDSRILDTRRTFLNLKAFEAKATLKQPSLGRDTPSGGGLGGY